MPQPKSLSQALKRAFVVALIVRAKAQTYLNSSSNSNRNGNSKKQIPFGDDNKKGNNKKGNNKRGDSKRGNSNCFPSHGF